METPDNSPAVEPAVEPAAATAPSPGAMIREARERARLSLEDLAAHTKLARHTLDALERDDFNALLEPVYVRGYYRKCAKVLEMDETKLLAAYQGRVSPRPPEAPAKLRLASGSELGSSSRLPVSMAITAAVAAVIISAIIWFAREQPQFYPPMAIPTAAPEATATPSAPVAEVSVANGTRTAAAAPPLAVPMPVAADQANTAAALQTGSTGTLRLRFSEMSWVRVDDAGGRTLLNEMRRAGSDETLTGTLPLSVFLGNAPGVKVEYDGGALDIGPHMRENNTARFTVPLR